MKVRTDYVSNSSSSSFVLAQNELFEFFKITKADIMDALLDAYGRDSYNAEVASIAKSISEHPEWHEDDIRFGSFGPIWVYDLWNKDDRREAIERWGGLLKEWDANNCHFVQHGKKREVYVDSDEIHKFNSVIDNAADLLEMSKWDLRELSANPGCKIDRFIPSNERDPNTDLYGHHEPIPKHWGDFIHDLRKSAGIMTNLDAVKAKVARFFVHADDNQLPYGEELPYGAEPDSNKKFDTEAYTFDRICEIILAHLVKSGRVKPDDPKFLEFMTVDDRYLSKGEKSLGQIYDFLNGMFPTWRDLKAAALTWNMHEG